MTCEVRCTVLPGLIDSERLAVIPTTAGHGEYVTVDVAQTGSGCVRLGFIGAQGEGVLVEFPREADSGHWRCWVPRERVTLP